MNEEDKNKCLHSNVFGNPLKLKEKEWIENECPRQRTGANFINAISTIGTLIHQKSTGRYWKNATSLLIGRSADSSIKEKYPNYVLFSDRRGAPLVKFQGIENVKLAHADRLKAKIFEAFCRLKLTKIKKSLSH